MQMPFVNAVSACVRFGGRPVAIAAGNWPGSACRNDMRQARNQRNIKKRRNIMPRRAAHAQNPAQENAAY
ncbi:MAG: hypothetical protein ACRC1H_06685 [Caldilineaceae bacterium]